MFPGMPHPPPTDSSIPTSPAPSRQKWRRLLPFLSWIGELSDSRVWRRDLLAGITVALVLVPQSMAYAQLAGLPAYYGLYAAFLPPIVAALFGSSRQLATGPVAVGSLMTAAALEPLATAGTPGYIGYATLLALLVGLIRIALGLLRLGMLVNFLSHPVVIGYTNAAALIIATSQLDKIFGVHAERATHHYETVWNILTAAMDQTHFPTLLMAAGAFVVMIGLRWINPRWPNVLIAVALTTALSWLVGFERKQLVPVEALRDPVLQQIVREHLDMRAEIAELSRALAEARARHARVLRERGRNDPETLAAQHAVELLRLKHDRRREAAEADFAQLRRIRLVRVPGEGPAGPAAGAFYPAGHEPPQAATDGRHWRVNDIRPDGTLLLHGGGRVVGEIPTGLPAFQPPPLDVGAVLQLLSAAIAISLIGFMEAISIAKAIATRTRQRLDADQELIGQGLANLVGSFFQSYPTSGSFSRSAVNLEAGAATGLSSVIAALVVVSTLLWFTPFLYHLPQATLAAVIMMAVVGLVNLKAMRFAWRAHWHDGAVALTTFALTLGFAPDLDKSILAGVGLSLILYLYRTMQPRVAVLARHPDGTLRDAEVFGLKTCDEISMIRFDGSLYFANKSYFEDRVLERIALTPRLKYVIVVGGGINQIDASGVEMLEGLAEQLHREGIELLFSGLKKQVQDVLERTGLYERLGRERFFRTEEQALHYVWERLGPEHAADCPLNIVCPVTPSQSRSALRMPP